MGQIYYLINCLPPDTGIRNNTHTAMVLDLLFDGPIFFDGPIIWVTSYVMQVLKITPCIYEVKFTILINCVPPDSGIRNNTHTAMVLDLLF